MKIDCYQCSELIEAAEGDDVYCPRCGVWLGIPYGDVILSPRPLTLKEKQPWQKFKTIFRSPKFMWPDELMHTYTKWHDKYPIVKRHCDWVDARLFAGSEDED